MRCRTSPQSRATEQRPRPRKNWGLGLLTVAHASAQEARNACPRNWWIGGAPPALALPRCRRQAPGSAEPSPAQAPENRPPVSFEAVGSSGIHVTGRPLAVLASLASATAPHTLRHVCRPCGRWAASQPRPGWPCWRTPRPSVPQATAPPASSTSLNFPRQRRVVAPHSPVEE